MRQSARQSVECVGRALRVSNQRQELGDDLAAGMNTQFLKQPVHVGVNRGSSDSKRRSDLLVLHAFKEAGQYLFLAAAKALRLGNLADLLDQLNQERNDLFAQGEFAFENVVNSCQQFLRQDRLDQKTLGASHQRAKEGLAIGKTGEHDDRQFRQNCSKFGSAINT